MLLEKGRVVRLTLFVTWTFALHAMSSGLQAQCPTESGSTSGTKQFNGTSTALAHYGFSVSGGGLIDGDEFADLVIGQPGAFEPGGQVFRVGRVFAKSGKFSAGIWEVNGENAEDLFGYAVGGGADVNGDGAHDFIVGAPGYDDGINFDAGRVYVFSGDDGSLLFKITGQNLGDSLGYSVAITESLNNDEFADFIFGAPGYDAGIAGIKVDAGRAYIVYGKSVGSTIDIDASLSDLIIDGSAAGDLLGSSVAGVGNWSNDDSADVIVGSPGHDAFIDGVTLVDAGRADIYSANNNTLLRHQTFLGETTLEHLGWSVADAGDVNGDCFNDVIIGAPGYDTLIDNVIRVDAGRAIVYLGPNHDTSTFLEVVGDNRGDSVGYDVSTAGNRNMDRYDDILIGAPGVDTSRGGVFIFHGRASALGRKHYSQADHSRTGLDKGDNAGFSVACAGSIDSDDADEQIYGAPGEKNINQGAGFAYVDTCFAPRPAPRSVTMDDVGLGDKLLFRWMPPDSAGQSSYRALLLDQPKSKNFECDGSIVIDVSLGSAASHVVFENLVIRQEYYAYIKAIYPNGDESEFESVPEDTAVYASTPVVCVHGLDSSPSTWTKYEGWFHSSHYNHVWIADNLNKTGVPGEENYDGNAENLSDFIEDSIQAFNSAYDSFIPNYDITSFDIVAHSMGGLISRRYASETGEPWGMVKQNRQVERLITLASPHFGTFGGEILKRLLNEMKRTLVGFVLAEILEFFYPAYIELSLSSMIDFNLKFFNHNGAELWAAYSNGGRADSDCKIKANSACSKNLRFTTFLEACPNDGVVNILSASIFPEVLEGRAFEDLCHTKVHKDSLIFANFTLSILETGFVPANVGFPISAFRDTTVEQLQVMYEACATISDTTRKDTFYVSDYGKLVVALTGPRTRLTCRLRAPNGTIWDSLRVDQFPSVSLYADDSLLRGYVIDLAEGSNADTGQWIVDYQRADSLMPFCITVGLIPGLSGATTLNTSLSPVDPSRIDTVTLLATLRNPSDSAILGALVTVGIDVETVDSTYSLPEDSLWDDGLHGDGPANDGVYGFQGFPWPDSGLYSFSVEASGVVVSDSFFRQSFETVYISAGPINLFCCDLSGDINQNGTAYEVTDLATLADILSNTGIDCVDCLPLLDVNGDCHISQADVDHLTAAIFAGGPKLSCSPCLSFTFDNSLDTDGDNVSNGCDICPGFDDLVDSDSDGTPDGCDACPTIPNPCPSCCDTPGDANNSGSVNIADVTFLIARIFAGGLAPPCADEGDASGDNSVNIADITYLIARIFAGGPAPVCGTTGG